MYSLFTLIIVASVSKVFTTPPVIVLSFDGFNPQFINDQDTPYLHNVLMPLGSRPPYMTSIFPSKTMVTHFTIATGAYPEDHGVYNNKMFDNNGNEVINQQMQFQTNDQIVPIWIENEKNNKHSAVMMWLGSDFDYHGVKPTYIEKYDQTITWNIRAKQIVDWMKIKDKTPNLVMAYFEYELYYEKSKRENKYKEYRRKIDNTIKQIYDGLSNANLPENFDIIIMSGHSMEQVVVDNIMVIEDIITPSNDIKVIVSGSLVFIRPKPELFESVKVTIKESVLFDVRFILYTKDTFHRDYKMKTKNLNGIITLVARYGHSFYQRQALDALIASVGGKRKKLIIDVDGNDPATDINLSAFFLGIGPRFNNNIKTAQPFNIIDVYAILKHLLGIPSAINIYQEHVTLNEIVKQILKS